MKVSIQERHIRIGKQCAANSCPVALAIREKYGLGINDVTVCDDEVVVHWSKEVAFYTTSPAANKFINEFDKGWQVEPIEIELTREGGWMELENIHYE